MQASKPAAASAELVIVVEETICALLHEWINATVVAIA